MVKSKRQKKIFLIINLSFFGDVILTGQLCSDIKINYPDSKLIFITNKPFVEAAYGLDGVDEVFAFDKKNKHKGIMGLLKFIFDFKYRNKIDTAVIIYGNTRGILLSWLLNTKNRLSGDVGIFNLFLTHKFNGKHFSHISDANANLLEPLTKKISNNNQAYFVPTQESKNYINDILHTSGYQNCELIGLAPISKKISKNWTPAKALEFIQLVNQSGKRVVITGTKEAKAFVKELHNLGESNFLDMTDKTSIMQFGALIKTCKAFVSVDTGALHLACATMTPTVCMFFEDNMLEKWAPKNRERNIILYSKEKISGKDAFENLEMLLKREFAFS